MGEPWERIKGETENMYASFCVYRDMGPDRSLRSASKKYGNDGEAGRYFERLSARFNWVERARLYDDHLERERRKAMEKERLDMDIRHARIGMLGLNKAVEKLREMDANSLTASDVVRLMDISARIERLARGASTEHADHRILLQGQLQIARDIIGDPIASGHIHDAIQQLAGSSGKSGGAGVHDHERVVESGTASDRIEQEAGGHRNGQDQTPDDNDAAEAR